MIFSASIQHLLNLEFKKCQESLQRYRRLNPPGKKIGREMAMAEFWINKLGEINWDPVDGAEAERRVGIWLEFEDQFGYPWPEHSFEKRFQEQYFGRIAKSLDASGQGVAPKLGQGTCTGLVYLRAGRPDEAITLLQKLVALRREKPGLHLMIFIRMRRWCDGSNIELYGGSCGGRFINARLKPFKVMTIS